MCYTTPIADSFPFSLTCAQMLFVSKVVGTQIAFRFTLLIRRIRSKHSPQVNDASKIDIVQIFHIHYQKHYYLFSYPI